MKGRGEEMETCKCIKERIRMQCKKARQLEKVMMTGRKVITGEKVGTDVRGGLAALKRNENRK
jgi:hypothetical protein